MLNIIVCVKQVHDPEAPASLFQISSDGMKVISSQGTPPVLNPFDENALEAALRIKDVQEAKITVLSMGFKLAKPVLRKTLAVGADELILLEDEQFQELDSYSSACVLAYAIQKIKNFDIIICGRQAADTDAGQVGSGIAEILQIPDITLASKVDVSGDKVLVERLMGDGFEVVEASMPLLITASNEIGILRYPPLKKLMAAQKMRVIFWDSADLDLENIPKNRVKLQKLSIPQLNRDCHMISGDDPEEMAATLAEVLTEIVR